MITRGIYTLANFIKDCSGSFGSDRLRIHPRDNSLEALQLVALKQFRGIDITYSTLQEGFLYLVEFEDLFCWNVLSWKLTGSLETELCLKNWS